eukprot:5263908-Ditylum_brightwellii.AAC.1
MVVLGLLADVVLLPNVMALGGSKWEDNEMLSVLVCLSPLEDELSLCALGGFISDGKGSV